MDENQPLYPQKDEFDNEWLCPYCTTLTDPADTVCPKCHHRLIAIKRIHPERSVWLWRGIFLQVMIIFYLISVLAGFYIFLTKIHHISDPLSFLPLYLGLPVKQSAELAQSMLKLFPRPVFWGGMLAIGYSLGVMALLYLRPRYGNVLYLINAGLMLLAGFLSFILFYQSWFGFIIGVIGMLVGLGQLVITFNLWNDFAFTETRLRLKVDSGVKGHQGFYLSGRNYAELGMWGAAVIHLRRAIARNPTDLSYRLALIVAYLNLPRYDLAQKELDQAKKQAPHSADIYRLEEKLADLKEKSVAL